MTQDPFSSLVRDLVDAHRTDTKIAPTGPGPQSFAEAYAVQHAVARHLGPPGGFKVGKTATGEVFMAPVWQDRVFFVGDSVPAGDTAIVELEVGFEIVAPLDDVTDRSDLARCLRPRPVFELLEQRLAGPRASDPYLRLADQQANGGIVVGPPLTDWDGGDFSQAEVVLTVDGVARAQGTAFVPDGPALDVFWNLHREIGSHCGGLRPGQIVITGALVTVTGIGTPAEVAGSIAGLGALSFRAMPR